MRLRNIPALTAAAFLVAIPVAFACDGGSHESAGGCLSKLPVTHAFKSSYSASHQGKRTMKLQLISEGSAIHHVKAEIYTFSGELVAKSRLYRGQFSRSKTIKLKLRYRSMQTGKYTLVVTGEPNHNRSCGPKRYQRVVEFYDCPKSLPVTFPNPPAGNARDYGGWLTVTLEPTGAVLRNVIVELYDADGNFFGRKRLGALYGTAQVPIELRHKLVDGVYTVIVTAPGTVPRRCGGDDVEAKKTLRFGPAAEGDGGGGGGGGDFEPDTGFGGENEDDSGFDPDAGFGDGGEGTEAR